MTQIFNHPNFKQRRRDLRKNMPNAEALIWWKVRNRQLLGFKFRRQFGIDSYIIDFYCPKAKIGIEIDGNTHLLPAQEIRDKKRQKFIESQGIKILRFTNNDVYENLEGVLEEIGQHLKKFSTDPNTSP